MGDGVVRVCGKKYRNRVVSSIPGIVLLLYFTERFWVCDIKWRCNCSYCVVLGLTINSTYWLVEISVLCGSVSFSRFGFVFQSFVLERVPTPSSTRPSFFVMGRRGKPVILSRVWIVFVGVDVEDSGSSQFLSSPLELCHGSRPERPLAVRLGSSLLLHWRSIFSGLVEVDVGGTEGIDGCKGGVNPETLFSLSRVQRTLSDPWCPGAEALPSPLWPAWDSEGPRVLSSRTRLPHNPPCGSFPSGSSAPDDRRSSSRPAGPAGGPLWPRVWGCAFGTAVREPHASTAAPRDSSGPPCLYPVGVGWRGSVSGGPSGGRPGRRGRSSRAEPAVSGDPGPRGGASTGRGTAGRSELTRRVRGLEASGDGGALGSGSDSGVTGACRRRRRTGGPSGGAGGSGPGRTGREGGRRRVVEAAVRGLGGRSGGRRGGRRRQGGVGGVVGGGWWPRRVAGGTGPRLGVGPGACRGGRETSPRCRGPGSVARRG